MKAYKLWIVLFFILLCLAGCGEQEATIEKETPAPAGDWRVNGFMVSDAVEEEQALWIEEHVSWQHDKVSYDAETEKIWQVFEEGSFGNKIYRLHVVTRPPDVKAVKWILETYDTSTMETDITEIYPEQVGIESMGAGLLVDMEVIGEQEYVFQMVDYGRNAEEQLVQSQNCMIYSDLKQSLQKTDLLPVYKEKGIVEESYDTILLQGECICDAAGNSYVRSLDSEAPYRTIYILDKEGALLMEYTAAEQEIILEPLRMAGGELAFPVYHQQDMSTRMVWFDVTQKKANILATLRDEQIQQMYGIQGNNIYYETKEGIVRWDIVTGSRKLIFDFVENGVSSIYDTDLVLREDGAVILRLYGTVNEELEDWLAVMSEEPVIPTEPISIVSLAEASERVEGSAAIAARKNPNYDYVFEETTASEREDYRTQIFAELAAGKGPDVLYVSREDMELLQKQGLLLDLRTMLSEETLEQVLPGVIELGTVDDDFVGLSADISVTTMMISKEVSAGETWKLEDMIALLESGKLNGRLVHGGMLFAPRAALAMLLRWNLTDCFLIDWEAGESHFEDERFCKLLEYSKAAGSEVVEVQGDPLGEAGNRMLVVGLSRRQDISEFTGTRGTENGYFIGMPIESGNGNLLESAGMLVVNKNASDVEAVSAYLECLLGDEVQGIGDELSVLKLSTEDITYTEDTGEALWKAGSKASYPLIVFEDGTTSLHEAKALLENCVPMPKTSQDLENIILEEVQAFYAGEKTAREVAEIIDNRVQLYLDEGN